MFASQPLLGLRRVIRRTISIRAGTYSCTFDDTTPPAHIALGVGVQRSLGLHLFECYQAAVSRGSYPLRTVGLHTSFKRRHDLRGGNSKVWLECLCILLRDWFSRFDQRGKRIKEHDSDDHGDLNDLNWPQQR